MLQAKAELVILSEQQQHEKTNCNNYDINNFLFKSHNTSHDYIRSYLRSGKGLCIPKAARPAKLVR